MSSEIRTTGPASIREDAQRSPRRYHEAGGAGGAGLAVRANRSGSLAWTAAAAGWKCQLTMTRDRQSPTSGSARSPMAASVTSPSAVTVKCRVIAPEAALDRAWQRRSSLRLTWTWLRMRRRCADVYAAVPASAGRFHGSTRKRARAGAPAWRAVVLRKIRGRARRAVAAGRFGGKSPRALNGLSPGA